MVFVEDCLLFVVPGLLFVSYCLLFVRRCLLIVVNSLWIADRRLTCSLFVVCPLLCAISCFLIAVCSCCLLCGVWCVLRYVFRLCVLCCLCVVRCTSLTVSCVLFAVICGLLLDD